MSNLNKIKEEGAIEFVETFCDKSFPNQDGSPFLDNGYYHSPDNHLSDKILDWHNKQMDKAYSLAIDEVVEIADSIEEYIAVKDQDGHMYQIPRSKNQEWNDFLDIPYGDEKSWDVPDFAERIDGQDLKSYKDLLKQKLLLLKNKKN